MLIISPSRLTNYNLLMDILLKVIFQRQINFVWIGLGLGEKYIQLMKDTKKAAVRRRDLNL
jgi:hypothetical protein